jgi:4'-phosphopantetheinyl transferase EntD
MTLFSGRIIVGEDFRPSHERSVIKDIVPTSVAVVEATGVLPDASLLPEETIALGRVSEGRRREFTNARTCARRALRELDLPPMPILPGLNREPLWPQGIVGSITHCRGYSAAAVARRVQVATIGIDVEVNAELPPGVLEIVALGKEVQFLNSTPQAGICWDRVMFSAKESVYKAWFQVTKRWLDFQDVSISIEPEYEAFTAQLLITPPMIDGRPTPTFEGRFRIDTDLIFTAVVIEATNQKPTTQQLMPIHKNPIFPMNCAPTCGELSRKYC